MKTNLIEYRFDISAPVERLSYQAMVERLKATPGRGKFMNCTAYLGEVSVQRDAVRPVTLKTDHLFANQWNTVEGVRVFDWYEPIFDNRDIRAGHYLEITDEMRHVRDSTYKCGYCGTRHSAPGYCTECVGSTNLKRDNLNLLELKAISDDSRRTGPIPAGLEVMWDHAQRQRLKRLVPGIIADADKAKAKIDRRAAGLMYAANHGIDPSNLIDYGPDKGFHLGWSELLQEFEVAQAKERLKDFPFRLVLLTHQGQILLVEEDL